MRVLDDKEINKAHAQGVYECMNLNKHKGSTPRIEGRKAIAKAQRKKDIEWLKDNTIEAWGGNRIILKEDWQSFKEVE